MARGFGIGEVFGIVGIVAGVSRFSCGVVKGTGFTAPCSSCREAEDDILLCHVRLADLFRAPTSSLSTTSIFCANEEQHCFD